MYDYDATRHALVCEGSYTLAQFGGTRNVLKDDRGVALLVCLLVVAILTIVVLAFHYDTQVDTALTANSKTSSNNIPS